MRRRLFNLATLLSAVLLLLTLGLWARSLGHHESVGAGYNQWTSDDEVLQYGVDLAWNANTFHLSGGYAERGPKYFYERGDTRSVEELQKLRSFRAGVRLWFINDIGSAMGGPRPEGFGYGLRRGTGGGWSVGLAVRPWAPAAMFAVLPLVWLYRRQRRRGWRFSLRESLVATTAVALLLCGLVLLKN
ncbi:hypothetical protein Pla123a_16770 [Posidoniimonas polymericola]|uniref:Uncharacterized protein n=1 Tax=Posidoniimonas polymericola TaxID=2528002 RepID=A0A5C5YSF2_9BACT|nr:hypothetical protein [Posidoniimonas polymericola]TWT77879.1 hypothetical protein Pla123a_16770 [Posidoniimonas polymericola]